MVEVELCYGQQDSGKWQICAEPTKERLDARERSVDQRGVLATHTVQYTHRLHQTLRGETGQSREGHQYKTWFTSEKKYVSLCFVFLYQLNLYWAVIYVDVQRNNNSIVTEKTLKLFKVDFMLNVIEGQPVSVEGAWNWVTPLALYTIYSMYMCVWFCCWGLFVSETEPVCAHRFLQVCIRLFVCLWDKEQTNYTLSTLIQSKI